MKRARTSTRSIGGFNNDFETTTTTTPSTPSETTPSNGSFVNINVSNIATIHQIQGLDATFDDVTAESLTGERVSTVNLVSTNSSLTRLTITETATIPTLSCTTCSTEELQANNAQMGALTVTNATQLNSAHIAQALIEQCVMYNFNYTDFQIIRWQGNITYGHPVEPFTICVFDDRLYLRTDAESNYTDPPNDPAFVPLFNNDAEVVRYRGDYSPVEQYNRNDVVHFQDNGYICLQSTGGEDPNLSDSSGPWKSLAHSSSTTTETNVEIRFTYRGLWQAETTYQQYDIVQYNQSLYIAQQTPLTQQPPDATLAYWEELLPNGIKWRGQYQDLVYYRVGDVVYWNGESFICVKDTFPLLSTEVINTTYWNYLAKRGVQGPRGPGPDDGDDGGGGFLAGVGAAVVGGMAGGAAAVGAQAFMNALKDAGMATLEDIANEIADELEDSGINRKLKNQDAASMGHKTWWVGEIQVRAPSVAIGMDGEPIDGDKVFRLHAGRGGDDMSEFVTGDETCKVAIEGRNIGFHSHKITADEPTGEFDVKAELKVEVTSPLIKFLSDANDGISDTGSIGIESNYLVDIHTKELQLDAIQTNIGKEPKSIAQYEWAALDPFAEYNSILLRGDHINTNSVRLSTAVSKQLEILLEGYGILLDKWIAPFGSFFRSSSATNPFDPQEPRTLVSGVYASTHATKDVLCRADRDHITQISGESKCKISGTASTDVGGFDARVRGAMYANVDGAIEVNGGDFITLNPTKAVKINNRLAIVGFPRTQLIGSEYIYPESHWFKRNLLSYP